MSSCAVKRGIITLRDCNNPVTGTCGQCSRPICTEHTATTPTGTLCVECHARNMEPAQSGEAKGAAKGPKATNTSSRAYEEYDDPAWPYMYRHHYYTHYHYSPFYSSGYYDSYYDDYDVRSMDTAEQADMGDVGEEGGGFYDS
jgi:hypothetical protein